MARHPLVSIVIPVKNGGVYLRNTLRAIFNQTLIFQSEVIIIDSGSTDDTLAILKEFPVRVISIPPADFNHGETRNLGAREAKGKYVVMTVQDAEPEHDRWLELLLEGFTDESVAGVCGKQVVPHDPDKNPIQWFRPVSQPLLRRYSFDSMEAFTSLTPERKREICSWDDVNAAYRKDILIQVPFRRVEFAEDALWASDALQAGYSIVYQPRSAVKHYHFETPHYTFRRVFTVSFHFYKAFGVKPTAVRNGLTEVLRNFNVLRNVPEMTVSEKVQWLVFNYRQRKAFNRAIYMFHKSLQLGAGHLDKIHAALCGRPPQAVKNNIRQPW